ncbi:MAG: hypothetical protein KGI05_09345, partial [Thaumarchaeota archaeon]|nr:hypothetical protein [Nitrososphaerota archaeon]
LAIIIITTMISLVTFGTYVMTHPIFGKITPTSEENSHDVKIVVSGLNDTYLVGQRINFNLTTTSKECSRPHVTLTSANGSIVWTNKPDFMFCDVTSASWQPLPWHWILDDGGLGSIRISETGTYKMTITFLGKIFEKEISIHQ